MPLKQVNGFRLKNALLHKELKLLKVEDDAQRPQLFLQVAHEEHHQSFQGFIVHKLQLLNWFVLARLHLIPKEKVLSEWFDLQIAINKTSPHELQAWDWLLEKYQIFYAEQTGDNSYNTELANLIIMQLSTVLLMFKKRKMALAHQVRYY